MPLGRSPEGLAVEHEFGVGGLVPGQSRDPLDPRHDLLTFLLDEGAHDVALATITALDMAIDDGHGTTTAGMSLLTTSEPVASVTTRFDVAKVASSS